MHSKKELQEEKISCHHSITTNPNVSFALHCHSFYEIYYFLSGRVQYRGGLPLWLVRCLSEHAIFKTSFSKYGTAYENMIRADAAACEGGILHA